MWGFKNVEQWGRTGNPEADTYLNSYLVTELSIQSSVGFPLFKQSATIGYVYENQRISAS